MRKLILKMSVTIDGFVGGPNGEIDWLFKTGDESGMAWVVDTLWQAGAHLMGSRTYQDMAAYWPTSQEPFAAPMNEIPKIVFSRSGQLQRNVGATTAALRDAQHQNNPQNPTVPAAIDASWDRPTVLGRNLVADITQLKQQPGKPLLAHGGAGFARSLVKHDLVDEYRLLTHRVALGRGLAIFSELPAPIYLELVDTKAFSKGTVAHVYQRGRE